MMSTTFELRTSGQFSLNVSPSTLTLAPLMLASLAIGLPYGRTSKASTTTPTVRLDALLAAGFCRPVASIVNVWLPLANPVASKMVSWYPSIGRGAYVSISATKTPSKYTSAIAIVNLRQPIQRTDVPLKLNVARAPAVLDTATDPMLHALFRLPCCQSPV